MNDFERTLQQYTNRDLEERRNWYCDAAAAYDRVRPHYPEPLVHRAAEVAQLPTAASILEVGCGPGTASLSFARLGYRLLCLEPNPEFYRLAQSNCALYANVEVRNISFEEWSVDGRFDAVLAASSIHWIRPEDAYPKAAAALRDSGSLILLWNMQMQPRYEDFQVLEAVFKTHAPALARYETQATQEENLERFARVVLGSGYFTDLVSEQLVCEASYSTDDYLLLLSSYSPYIALAPEVRTALFAALRETIEQRFGGTLPLSYLSAYQVGRKRAGSER